MTKAKTYGALLLVGTTAILAGGCGDKTEPVKQDAATQKAEAQYTPCLLYTSPSPRDS